VSLNSTQPAPDPHGLKRTIRIAALIAAVLVAAAFGVGFGYQFLIGSVKNDAVTSSEPTFVGSNTCASCHRSEADLWRGSQHKLAMQHATGSSMLGDFNDASFDHYGVHSRFFRKEGKYLVETDGADGKLATFEVKYTFGVDPLQQYLVEFPDGRLQALSLAWDTRPKERGGQRWFHLYPNEEIKHDDVLHWTKLNQNWNFMCAECHSTGVHKNYDATNDRFATTWAEISVGCEACHGQGSRHIAWAHDQQSWWSFARQQPDRAKGLLVRLDERHDVVWRHDPSTGNPQRNFTPALVRKEVETCGLCHARRSEFSEDRIPGRWLSDTHLVSPLTRGLYYPDGQMRDEVYNYGSFKQSKMFAAGVTCGDCHEPHAAKLRVTGDGVCLQCHAPDKYAAAIHNRHSGANPPPTCASCHMPARTYMVVDRRHDHSFRIPRPDVSVKLGTPNTCNDCHTDKSPEWAATAIESWHGPNRVGFQNYTQAFHAAWSDPPNAETLLAAVATDSETSAFARASALTELAPHVSAANVNLARSGLSDPDPMVRIGALDMLEGVPPSQIWPLVSPLLTDASRGVRIKAADLLAAMPAASQPSADREKFERAAAEFVAAQRLNADRPESRSRLGNFYARRGFTADAEVEYRAALKLSPQYAPAAINLADLYRQLGRDGEGEGVLHAAIMASSGDAGLHYALGLTLIRLKQHTEALRELRRAAELNRDNARYAYVYGVALHSAGQAEEAMVVLKENLVRHPDDRDTLLAVISYHRDAGDFRSALENAERLAKTAPVDRELANLIEDLRRRTEGSDAQR
jgi:predicted CXXCH cytochrome family protein